MAADGATPSPTRATHGLPRVCARIADSPRFQAFISAVIVANAVTLGLGTYDWSSSVDSLLTALDDSVEEMHQAEREEARLQPAEELEAQDETVAERLAEIRASLDKLETQLAEGRGDLPGPRP